MADGLGAGQLGTQLLGLAEDDPISPRLSYNLPALRPILKPVQLVEILLPDPSGTPSFADDGGEATSDLSNWTAIAGDATSSASKFHGGARAIKLNTGNPAVLASVYKGGILADAGRRISTWFLADHLGGAANVIRVATSAGTVCFSIRRLADGTLALVNSADTTLASGATVIPLGGWHRIALCYTIVSTTVNSFAIYLDDVLEIQAMNVTISSVSTDRLYLTITTGAGTDKIHYFDDVRVFAGASLADPGDPTILRYAGRDVLVDGFFWSRRLTNELIIEKRLQDVFYGLLQPTNVEVRLSNIDRDLTPIFGPTVSDKRGSGVNLYSWDEAVGGAATLESSGVINTVELGEEVSLQVATEDPAILGTLLPRESFTRAQFPSAIDVGFPIPVVFGRALVPLAYVYENLEVNTYLYSGGPNLNDIAPKVYRDNELVPANEYLVWPGTYNNSVNGVGGGWIGHLIVSFTVEQRDFSGRLYNRIEGDRMTADLIGVVDSGSPTAALIMRWILDQSLSGAYGLSQVVDDASFDAAVAYIKTIEIGGSIGWPTCDSTIVTQRPAKEYLDELALIGGLRLYQGENGVWFCAVDQLATEYVGKFGFADDGMLRNLTQEPTFRRVQLHESVGTLDVEFRWDLISRTYTRMAATRIVSSSGQPKLISSNWVWDVETGDWLSDYLTKRFKSLEQVIDTEAGSEALHLDVGDRITVDAPAYGLSGPFEVQGIRKGLNTVGLTLTPYSALPYTYTPGPVEA